MIVGETKIGIHFDRLEALPYRFVVEMRKGEQLCQVGSSQGQQYAEPVG